MDITFSVPDGVALVIAGDQGCGKSRLARQLAEAAGPFSECSADDLRSHFGLARALANSPKTLIIEVGPLPGETKVFDRIQSLIAAQGGKIEVDVLGKGPTSFTGPRVIVCTPLATSFQYSRRALCILLPTIKR